MKVNLKDDRIQLVAETAQDRVYLKHFMGRELNTTYIEHSTSEGELQPFEMNIDIFTGEKESG